MRVLLHSKLERIEFHSARPISIDDANGHERRFEAGAVTVQPPSSDNGHLIVNGDRWETKSVTLRSASANGLSFAPPSPQADQQPSRYPGVMSVTIADQRRLSVVNRVDVEEYVACVVGREAWPTFDPEAFKVQAIVARTFVLYQMLDRQKRDYDVTGSQGSQVYRGLRDDATGRRAVQSTRETYGIALTWHDGQQDQLFCSYYSSACGGLSQSAEIFGDASTIGPLRGGIPCDYCRIAPGRTYRWGPIELAKADVLKRLTDRYSSFSSLKSIQSIQVLEKTTAGRPTMLRVVGTSGETEDILAERFRQTIGPSTMRSTDCRIRVRGSQILLDRGRGFGHGLGLCQWGAQGQALEGKPAADILRYYFPGANVMRVY